ncbi:MAG: hypothetical protein AAGA58_02825 [Verrucomicrobiota bacterium]
MEKYPPNYAGPVFLKVGYGLWRLVDYGFWPSAFVGTSLFVIAFAGLGSARLRSFCEIAFPVLSVSVACFSFYFIVSGAVGIKVASNGLSSRTYFTEIHLHDWLLAKQFENGGDIPVDEGKVFGLTVEEVPDISAMPSRQAWRFLQFYKDRLHEEREEATKRRLIATLALYTHRRVGGFDEKGTAIAAKLGVPAKGKWANVRTWVHDRLGENGWHPYPPFVLHFPQL